MGSAQILSPLITSINVFGLSCYICYNNWLIKPSGFPVLDIEIIFNLDTIPAHVGHAADVPPDITHLLFWYVKYLLPIADTSGYPLPFIL